MQKDKQFRRDGGWGLASDGIQWVLQRKNGNGWEGVSFVATTKTILARCMREKGVPNDTAAKLLGGLPDSFNAWMDAQHDAVSRLGQHQPLDASKSAMMATDATATPLAA